MNVSQFLDRTARFDGIQSGDSDYPRRRALHLEWTQEAVDEFCLTRPFAWRLLPITLTIVGPLTSAELPDDFVEVGAVGSVVDTVTMKPIYERSPIMIQELQRQPPRVSHEVFGVFRRSASTTVDPGAPLFQIGANGSTLVALMWYLSAPPTLVDSALENSGLDRIPAQYHFSYLLNKVKAKIAFANEASRDFYDAQATIALNIAIKTDGAGRNSSIQAMPSASPGKW